MTLKLTPKQLMLIIMSVLLVLTVTMSAIVVSKVGNIVKGLGGPSVNQPATPGPQPSGTDAPTQGKETEPAPTDTKAPTKPQETEPDHEHVYKKSQTVAATCTDMGYTIYLCSCGKNDIRDFHDARGHKYGEEELLEASCGKTGYRQAICQRCGAVDTREVFDALEHDYELVEKQELTCVQNGYEEYKCKHCGDVKRENEQEAQGHQWEEPSQIVKDPTDVAPGEEQKTCTVCGETETVLISPTGDVEITSKGVRDENGWKEYVFKVGTQSNPDVYIYSIWIAAEHTKLEAVFSMSGLTVTYEDGDGVKQQHILKAYSNEVLAIDVDGNTSDEIPDLTQDPSEEPTGEPTGESTGEPTGEPTEEPTGEPTEESTGTSVEP